MAEWENQRMTESMNVRSEHARWSVSICHLLIC